MFSRNSILVSLSPRYTFTVLVLGWLKPMALGQEYDETPNWRRFSGFCLLVCGPGGGGGLATGGVLLECRRDRNSRIKCGISSVQRGSFASPLPKSGGPASMHWAAKCGILVHQAVKSWKPDGCPLMRSPSISL